MTSRGKSVLLAISLLANVLLVGTLVVVVIVGIGVPSVLPTKKEAEQADRLVLALRCGDGDKDACAKSLAVDKDRCAAGDAQGCVLLGIAHQVGKAVPKDESAAVPFFVKACSLGDGNGCWYAGTSYLNGRGVARDVNRAVELLTKACDKGEKNGCLDLGEAHLRRTPPDKGQALDAYDRGCKLGYDWCCNRGRELRRSWTDEESKISLADRGGWYSRGRMLQVGERHGQQAR